MTNVLTRCFRSPGAPIDSPCRLVRILVNLDAYPLSDARSTAKSLGLLNNLKNCYQRVIELIVTAVLD